MAVKSVIDIDLNDEKFKEFLAAFQRYQGMLATHPDVWAKVTKNIAASKAGFEGLVAGMIAQKAHAELMAKAQAKADELTRTTADRWRDMAKTTKSVAGNIADATISLLKWSGIISAVTGLLGAGGIYGIDRLASSVSTTRRSSLGLGLSYGEQQAFGLVYGRLVDPGSFLGGVSDALADPRKRIALNALGLTGSELQGDTAQVGAATLEHLRAFAKRTPEQYLGTYAEAYHLGDLGVGVEDLRRLRNTSDEEFNSLRAKYRQTVGQVAVTDETQRKWQDFTTQLGIAGEKIKSVFVEGLVALAPELTKLSDSFSEVVKTLVGSQGFKDLIDTLAEGLKEFAAYVGTDDFKNNVKEFAEGVESLAKAIVKGLQWLGVIPSPQRPEIQIPGVNAPEQLPGGGYAVPLPPRDSGKLPSLDQGANDNEDLLDTIRHLEGSGDREVSKKGAIGRYQIMPGTARQYGYDPARLTDPVYSRHVAQAILADLKKRYHGNITEELIAYNAGPGVADAFDRAGGGASGYAALPAETRRYLAQAGGMRNDVNIYLYNKTGGDVVASTSALAR